MTNLEFCKYLETLPRLTTEQELERDQIKSEIAIAREESTKAERKAMHKYFDFISSLHPDTVIFVGTMYNGKPYVTTVWEAMCKAVEWNWRAK